MSNFFSYLYDSWTNAWDNYYENGIVPNIWKGITGQKSADRNADKNLGFQKDRAEIEDERYEEETAYNRAWAEEQRDYERELQQQIFEREDTAIERQAQQLSNLGINPLSQQLNGLGAGSAVGATPAPAASGHIAEVPQRTDTSRNNLGYVLELFNALDNFNTNGQQRDLLIQQSNIAKAQAEAQKIDNIIKMNKNGITVDENGNYVVPDFTHKEQDFSEAEYKDKNATAERNERENQYQKDWDVTDNTSKNVRSGTDISARFATDSEKQNELVSNSPFVKASDSVKKSLNIAKESTAKSLKSSVQAFNKMLESAGKQKNKFKEWWKKHSMNSEEMKNAYGF